MAAERRTVRVFISSTFRDMHAERDHLVTVVFPELRERLERLGLDFFDVDLRWGVPAKDANGETANSWAYCKQWIDRVQPFFVCILGQRYGWTPPANEIRDEADRRAFAGMSITEMEIRHAVLTGRLRRRSLFYFRNTRVPTRAPAKIRKEFVDVADEGRLNALKDKITQESGRPVRPYDCHWTGSGFDSMDAFGRAVLEDLWSGVLRDKRYVSKTAWRKALRNKLDRDRLYADETQPVPREVWEKIVEHARPAPRDPLDAEAEQMDAFAASRLRWFQGRTSELQQLTDFLHSTAADAPRLAVVAAVPGQGKSALLAKLSTLIPQPSTFLITHFVGATERSATAHALVERLLAELDRSGITWPAEEQNPGQEPKRDFNSLCLRLAQRLGDYAGERRVVILLDALNQLSDGHDLQWLPTRLGPGVRVIVSCIEDAAAKADSPEQRVLRALASRQPAPLRVPLGPLTETDVRTIVVAYLKEYCHELDREHLDTLCAITQARNPLYLLVMLNELRTLGGNDLNRIVPALIASMPQDHPDTVSLFRWVLQRMEVFNQYAPDAVRWWCLYLAHGRVGMASHELADLLDRKLGANAAATALLIERGLRRYLQRRGPQLDFFHGQLRQAVFEQYGPQAEATNVHSDIATYFRDLADPAGDGTWAGQYIRGWSELAYHMFHEGRTAELRELLMTYLWIRGRLRGTDVVSLIDDYDLLNPGRNEPLGLVHGALQLSAHVLSHDKRELPTQLTARLLGLPQPESQELLRQVRQERHDPWLRPLRGSLTAPGGPLLWTLEGHRGPVRTVAMTPDGRRAISGSEDRTLKVWDLESGICLRTLEGYADTVVAVAVTPDGRRALSTSKDKTMKVWDLQSGTCLQTLEVDRDGALTADGRVAISGSEEGTMKVWDLESGTCLRMLKGHADCVNAVAVTPDGRQAISASDDETLKVWNLDEGDPMQALDGHCKSVLAVAVTPDGEQGVSGACDKTLKVWDLGSGACLRTLEGHGDAVLAVAVTPNGQRAISGSEDKTLKVWDLAAGTCLRTLEGHDGAVRSVAVTQDGQQAISGSEEGTMKVWDLESGTCLRTLRVRFSCVLVGLLTSDGRRAFSVTQDQSLSIWDLDSGKCLRTLDMGFILRFQEASAISAHGEGWFRTVCSTDRVTKAAYLPAGAYMRRDPLPKVPRRAVAVTPDGRQAIFAFLGGKLLVHAFGPGVLRGTLSGHSDAVRAISVTPDGRLAISGSADRTLKVWDLRNGETVASFTGEAEVNACAAGDDGVTFAAGDLLGRVHFLRLENLPGRNASDHGPGG